MAAHPQSRQVELSSTIDVAVAQSCELRASPPRCPSPSPTARGIPDMSSSQRVNLTTAAAAIVLSLGLWVSAGHASDVVVTGSAGAPGTPGAPGLPSDFNGGVGGPGDPAAANNVG